MSKQASIHIEYHFSGVFKAVAICDWTGNVRIRFILMYDIYIDIKVDIEPYNHLKK